MFTKFSIFLLERCNKFSQRKTINKYVEIIKLESHQNEGEALQLLSWEYRFVAF